MDRATEIEGTLLDRIESDRPGTGHLIARDIADLLGARRAFRGRVPSVLGWGLPDMGGLSPASSGHRQQIARSIVSTLERFESRLADISVKPLPDSSDFVFEVQARLRSFGQSERLLLRILAPRRGGALSADVELVSLNIGNDT